jgi:type I restriction enzyme S subunit
MKRYSLYKDSGVEWIGEIPSHWECIRLGMLGTFSSSGIDKKSNEDEVSVRMVNYTDLIQSRKYKPVQISDKEYMRVTTPQSKLEEHRLVKGDMVFIPSSETSEDLGYSSLIDFDDNDIVYSYHILRYKTKKPVFHYFKKYLVNHHSILNQFSSEGKGTTRQIIGRSVFNNVRVVLPPIPEQKKIVEFLDDKTQQIDNLIQNKEKKIELIKEKRTSLINHVVTKGLNPNVKMKDSGVEWIGEIPSHWKVDKVKFLGKIGSGDTLESKFIEKDEGNYPVYGGNGVMGYYSDFNFDKPILIIGRVGEKCGNVHYSDSKVFVNDNSLVFQPFNEEMNLWYVYHSLVQRDLNQLRNKNTQPLITGTMVKDEFIPNPPIDEQKEIVKYLDEQTKEIDDLIQLEQKKIELLKEYRQSLISEVVTGKVRVCEEDLSEIN